jgi:hypothetical protein
MTSERHFRSAVCGIALLIVAAASSPAFAEPRGEPLVFTTSPDPDPDFVPPREPRHPSRPAKSRRLAKGSMEQVMEDLGRLTGQLGLLGEQVLQSRSDTHSNACAALAATGGSGTDHSELEQRCSQ